MGRQIKGPTGVPVLHDDQLGPLSARRHFEKGNKNGRFGPFNVDFECSYSGDSTLVQKLGQRCYWHGDDAIVRPGFRNPPLPLIAGPKLKFNRPGVGTNSLCDDLDWQFRIELDVYPKAFEHLRLGFTGEHSALSADIPRHKQTIGPDICTHINRDVTGTQHLRERRPLLRVEVLWLDEKPPLSSVIV